MSQATKLGLTRIVLLSPQRRVDLALPEYLPLVTVQPLLLKHAGTGLADEGIAHHGWVLRRLDGSILDAGRSLAAQNIHDGETLVLAPQDQQWPEPEYDDLADAAANEARQLGATWAGRHTRAASLLLTTLVLVCGLVLALRSGPHWTVAGASLCAAAVMLLTGGGLAARIGGRDTAIATILSMMAYPYAGLGAALLVTGEGRLGPGQLLVGAAALVATAAVALVATGLRLTVHVAVLTAALLTALAALLSMALTAQAASAVVACVILLASPWLPRIAKYQAGLPSSTVHMPSAETPVDEPLPAPAVISVLVRRSDNLLTGMLYGMCAVLVGAVVVLAGRDDLSARLLAGTVLLVCALRARAFAALRHRMPLLGTATAAGLTIVVLMWESLASGDRGNVVAPIIGLVLLVAGAAAAIGKTYLVRRPSPQLGRIGDFVELFLVVASPVLAAAIAGIFGYVRGLGG